MTVCFTTLSLCLILVSLSLCSEAHESLVSSTTSGLRLDLIHRDFSPLSPFYNPLATHSERLENVIRRSNSRLARHFKPKCISPSKSPCLIESTLRQVEGDYLMKLLIGTPPVEILVTADTGSDLTWIQCKPCKRCFQHINPLFNQRASSSYKTLKCTSNQCKAFEGFTAKCTQKHNRCRYNVTYGDGSYSHGHLATETLTFGKTSIEKYVFGCGHNNRGLFSNSSSGVIGLGRGALSIVSQLEESIRGRFSYCLVPFSQNETSTIHFGENAQVSLSRAVIVGNKSFEVPVEKPGGSVQSGNIMLDSGSSMTYLPKGEFYDSIVSAIKEAMSEVETIDDPGRTFHFCYKTKPDIKAPRIGFQFKDAAVLEIPESNIFVEVSDGVTCFTVAPTHWPFPLPIFGSALQWNFVVSCDLRKKMVSFQATDCSKKV
ncbi:hypothetical protein DCAR_0624931 [Daucus carota subsp. sativus]|uniref:Peptidase A1 domain-containing protein n=1 Tax=Daucus carota subsp. sativus TaxID=79200 RepID=A0AAF0XEV8_DAUCS|nr:hypothetical protein DCAR_0624931 [Daucus carota subsp. sativus]